MRPHDAGHPDEARFVANVLDLLEPGEERDFRAHVDSCEVCRDRLDSIELDSGLREHPRHIPASILARWNRLETKFGRVESAIYEAHLQSCEVCSVALSEVTGRPRPRRADSRSSAQLANARPLASRARLAASWGGLGLAAGFAVAMLLTFLLSRADRQPVSAAPRLVTRAPTPRADTLAGTGLSTRRVQLANLALLKDRLQGPIALQPLMRGESSIPTASVPAGSQALQLRIPPTTWIEPSHPISIRVIGPDDRTVAGLQVTSKQLNDRPVLLLVTPSPLRPGRYRVVLQEISPPGSDFEAEAIEYPLQLK